MIIIEDLDEDAPSNDLFEEEWSALTWSLLAVLSRLRTRTIDIEEGEQQKRLNVTLVSLVNKSVHIIYITTKSLIRYKIIKYSN
uniref:Uncharacterized protein n=1 Tax=Heterorhabditis bacteriophora TaxID=37862 RepID=A0A1I7WIP6_HETBA